MEKKTGYEKMKHNGKPVMFGRQRAELLTQRNYIEFEVMDMVVESSPILQERTWTP